MKSCPKCKSNMDMDIDIEYGFPYVEMLEDANNNKIELGGCCIGPDDHKYKCKSCGKKFGGSDAYE